MSTEIEQLNTWLTEDWRALSYEGIDAEGWEDVDTIEGSDRRWYRQITKIFKSPSGKYFSWYYDQGLTESQENECYCESAVEVLPVKKMIETTEWVNV